MYSCKLTCDRIGHDNEVIISICIKKECNSPYLCCKQCIVENHRNHNIEEFQDIYMKREQVNEDLKKLNQLPQLIQQVCDICYSGKLEIQKLITQIQQDLKLAENPTITQFKDWINRLKQINFEREYEKLIETQKVQLDNITIITQQVINETKSLLQNEIIQIKKFNIQHDNIDIRFDINNIQFKQTQSVEGYGNNVIQVAISKNDKYVATGLINFGVNLWDIKLHQIVALFKPQLPFIYSIQFSNDNNRLAIGTDYEKHNEGVIEIFDLNNLQNDQAMIRLEGHYGKITGLLFTEDSKYLMSVSWDQQLLIWDLIQEQEKALINKQFCQSSLSSVTYTNEQQLIVCSGYGGHTYLFDCREINSLKLKVQWESHFESTVGVVFIKNSTVIMTSNKNETRFWYVDDILKNKINHFKEIKHGGGMTVKAYPINDPQIIINWSQDSKLLYIWNYESNKLLQSIKLPIGLNCQSFDMTSDFSRIIVGGHEQNYNLFERVDQQIQL